MPPVQSKKLAISAVNPKRVFDRESAFEDIHAHFQKRGYAVVRVCTEQECDAHIIAQVKHVLLKQPWKKTLEVRDPKTRRVLDIDADREAYLRVLKAPLANAETLKEWENAWSLHAGFGAPCDGPGFHYPEYWALRSDRFIYELMCALTGGRKRLWVDINRPIHKLPGKGEEEFLHYDLNPFGDDDWDSPLELVAGKVCFTESEFICVPKSSTERFHQRFKRKYMPLYPNAETSGAAKFPIDPKRDPMDLLGKRVAIQVPAGCYIVWSPRLVHGVRARGKDKGVGWGGYMGYFKAGARAEYKRRAGVDELEDRIHSYQNGVAPKLWPSFDRIHYYPNRYKNYTRMLQPYVDKCVDGWPGVTTRIIKSGPRKGEVTAELLPVPDPDYEAPPLTKLGEKLLGIRPWKRARRVGEKGDEQ